MLFPYSEITKSLAAHGFCECDCPLLCTCRMYQKGSAVRKGGRPRSLSTWVVRLNSFPDLSNPDLRVRLKCLSERELSMAALGRIVSAAASNKPAAGVAVADALSTKNHVISNG